MLDSARTSPRPSVRSFAWWRRRAARRSLRLLPLWLLPLLVLAACGRTGPGEDVEAPPAGTPRLVVLVVSDQFRADYLERVRPLFTDGLARLAAEGVVFTKAHHGHAGTNTAPGHATLATGSHPVRHGIVGNYWVDRTTGLETYCTDDPRFGTSPANLRAPTLGDWLKARYPASKVVAASGKDRGAVLPGGRDGDVVVWFDEEVGGFTTSGFYADEAPDWLETFNAAGPPVDVYLSGWEALPGTDPAAAAAAGFEAMDRGPFDRGFPRVVGDLDPARDDDYWDDFYRTPILDAWLGGVGRELVERYELGSDEWPDLLALSFSSLDTVGHGYGPNSPEVLDTLLRLDRTLGELFRFLDQRLGRDAYVVAFSSDHGVVPLPEVREHPELRAGFSEVRCLRQVASEMEVRYGADPWLEPPWSGAWYLDTRALAARGHDPVAVAEDLAARLEACPHVESAWTYTELAEAVAELPGVRRGGGNGLEEAAARLDDLADGGDRREGTVPRPPLPLPNADFALRHAFGFDADRTPDVSIQWEEGFLPAIGSHTGHGSPYAYDTHVPFILLSPSLPAGRVDELVLTVDLAPTLAALLDVTPPPEIDGRNRLPLARHPGSPPHSAPPTTPEPPDSAPPPSPSPSSR